MRNSLTAYFSKLFLMLIVFTGLAGAGIVVKSQANADRVPPGKWTFSAGPYFGSDYESIPVDVFRVTTNAAKGLTITSVGLHNKDTRNVTGVRMRWYLKDKDQNGRVLLEGETPLIEVSVSAGKGKILDYPVVSFAGIHKSLMKNGSLSGNFRLEIAVFEVHYADQTAWAKGQISRLMFKKAAYSVGSTFGCQGQGCSYNGTPGVESYQCGSNVGTTCVPSTNGQSCTESRCPKSGDDEFEIESGGNN